MGVLHRFYYILGSSITVLDVLKQFKNQHSLVGYLFDTLIVTFIEVFLMFKK